MRHDHEARTGMLAMNLESSDPAATLHALCGESDLRVIAPAFSNRRFARILALAPGVDPVVGALGALAGGLPNLLTPAGRASPALSAAIASLIGTDAGHHILGSWANVAPAGWGAAHAAALIDAVRHDRCARWAAAALMGPTSDAAALLYAAQDIALAIRRWGQTTPDDPTAWMNTLPLAERDRLLDALRTDSAAALCLPWLPAKCDATLIQHLEAGGLFRVFAAYTTASPVARARHVGVLSTLFQRAERYDLGALTRLAVASHMDAAWDDVVRLLRAKPWDAIFVVEAAPWNLLRSDVQTLILSAADNDLTSICATIAFARGDRDEPDTITPETTRAFFAAAMPTVWNTLAEEKKRVWLRRFPVTSTHLAVRSLGIDPMFLMGTELYADLVAAVRHHLRDDAAVQQTLLPVAVYDLPIAAIPAIIATLPPPPDPVAFVQIARGMRMTPQVLRERDDDAAVALDALAAASPDVLTHVWSLLPETLRHAVLGDENALIANVAAPERAGDLAQALRAWDANAPQPLLALRLLIDADEERRARGVAALAKHPDLAAALLPLLRNDVYTALMSNPTIVFTCADLPSVQTNESAHVRKRCR